MFHMLGLSNRNVVVPLRLASHRLHAVLRLSNGLARSSTLRFFAVSSNILCE